MVGQIHTPAFSQINSLGIDTRGWEQKKVETSTVLPAYDAPNAEPSTKPFDVLHYNLLASLAMTNAGFGGVISITCLITEQTDSLYFHSLGLVFDTVRVNEGTVSYTLFPAAERFSVHLGRVYAVGETAMVRIVYTRDVSYPRFEERQGYYWYRKDYQPGLVLENIGYTFSEPYDARLWMPCYDDPSDKATSEMRIEVPTGYNAASNGKLVSITSTDSTKIFHWREDYPITTYLMCITVSKYSTFSHYYHPNSQSSDSIEVKYYMWQADSAGAQYNAVQAFSKTTDIMRTYTDLFGEYPFEKYGMAAVYPFPFGGMEHQTMTSVHRSWLSVSGYPFYEDGIAHELAHQWWGNMVTCRTFADIWLNEGFASYSEALWREGEYSAVSYDQKMRSFRTFDQSWRGAIFDPTSQGLPLFGSSVYHKGAWVLHMLRRVVGDSLFFATLENYRMNRSYGTAATTDLLTAINAATGKNYSWFFTQWVFGRGWPIYAYTTLWDPNLRTYSMTIYQRQDTLWPTFTMPIEVKLFAGGRSSSFILADSLRTQTFVLPFGIRPDSLQFDTRNSILKQMMEPPDTAISREELPTAIRLYRNYPNPFNPSTVIEYDLPQSAHAQLTIYDLLGRVVAVLVDEVQNPGNHRVTFSTTDVASGLYFYRLMTPNGSIVRKMLILK